jgi:3-deoxy-D-manno-octulosonic-acid transferase
MLYSLLLYFLFPFVLLRLLWQSRANPAYRQRITERLGFVNLDNSLPIICIHAVSVGETIAAVPLIDVLSKQYPNHRLLVTTTTPTGSDQVKALFSERVLHSYLPYDLPGAVSRFLKRTKPEILIVMETEIWPNLYALCKQNNIPLMIVNARLSNRSLQAYLKIRNFIAETLQQVNIIAVRSETDAKRFYQLGAPNNHVQIVGNIKYDVKLNRQLIEHGRSWREEWGSDRPVWVAASTHAGEDQIILDIYKRLLEQFPDLVLVLVPRHPERFDSVNKICHAFQQLNSQELKVIRHSNVSSYKDQTVNIVLGDSMGEMQSWYACADVVFMGGSLVESGGHNPLEATAMGVPVVSGQFMFNFEDIVKDLRKTELLKVCENQSEIEASITSLLVSNQNEKHNYRKQDYQQQAELFMQQHQGVTVRLSQLVSSLL